jgi:fructose-1-phosphate kinase PfkB-like protein
MPYVKTKHRHLQAGIDNHLEMLKVSNQQLGQALQLALKERDDALAQVEILQDIIQRMVVIPQYKPPGISMEMRLDWNRWKG